MKRICKTGAEVDCFSRYSRKLYCYLQRAGATSSIKRGARRRERRDGKNWAEEFDQHHLDIRTTQ